MICTYKLLYRVTKGGTEREKTGYIYIYIYIHTRIEKYAYQPTAERDAVTWHIISHTRKGGPPIETVEITKFSCDKKIVDLYSLLFFLYF